MALLQVFTGTACNNKTGCIGQPTYAESVIHETSGKRQKTTVNDGVNKCQLYHKPAMAISKPFKNKTSMLWETVLDVLHKSCILSHVFLSTLVFHITNLKYSNLGPS